MKGWRRAIQMWRVAATSGRFCSTARRSVFMRQTEVAQQPPDRVAVHRGPMRRGPMRRGPVRRGDFGGQFRRRQVPFLPDPAGDPRLQPGQLAMPSAIALRFGCKEAWVQGGLGARPPVACLSFTLSLTNFTEVRNRAAAERCVFPSATKSTTRGLNSTGCGLPIIDPHIRLSDRESHMKPVGNPEAQSARQATGSGPMVCRFKDCRLYGCRRCGGWSIPAHDWRCFAVAAAFD